MNPTRSLRPPQRPLPACDTRGQQITATEATPPENWLRLELWGNVDPACFTSDAKLLAKTYDLPTDIAKRIVCGKIPHHLEDDDSVLVIETTSEQHGRVKAHVERVWGEVKP